MKSVRPDVNSASGPVAGSSVDVMRIHVCAKVCRIQSTLPDLSLRRNVRFAEKMIGDLRAQVAAGWAGSRALEWLAAEFGFDSLGGHADEIMCRTEAGMRAGIAALPDGEYHEEMEIEDIADPQTLAVTVRIEGSDVHADFTGTAPQVRRPAP